MHPIFADSPNYAALSLNDLLKAREEYHDDLMCRKNVVATAVGLYRIRKTDPWPDSTHKNKHKASKGKRTLFNSEIRPYSWPCVYVFVSDWVDENSFGDSPWDAIPKMLRMKEKSVPVCVIEAKRQQYSTDAIINPGNPFPRNTLVPGSPIVNEDAQGMPRLATAGCMVQDGERYYILTNKHAVGAPGTPIYAFNRYQVKPIGVAAEKAITRKPFQEVYPHLASESQYLQMDIGLVEVSQVQDWQTRIPGLGLVENVLDLYDNHLSLNLLGQKVVGLGAVSGFLRGEIQGLFYRYKSIGGYEYLSDFLIGPESDKESRKLKEIDNKQNVSFKVHHGDSGTLLLIEEEVADNHTNKIVGRKYHPFALLWGKHEFLEGDGRQVQPYALATSLSTTLNLLELDFVRDLNMDNEMVWGFIGHYAIARKLLFAVDLLNSSSLKAFIKKNLDLLAMGDDEIRSVSDSPRPVPRQEDGTYDETADMFVPLADVPDNVWKSNVNKYIVDDGNKKSPKPGPGNRGQRDNPNHFADADLVNENGDSLISLYQADKVNNLTPSAWLNYYASVESLHEKWDNKFKPGSFNKRRHWGALPFRVWQIVDEMIGFAAAGNQDSFFCAGGVLIHYVGDACQPLHSSWLSQGDPSHPKKSTFTKGAKAGETKWMLRGDGVHGGYEDDMINAHASDIMDGLEAEIKRQQAKEPLDPVISGYDAAVAIMELIIATQKDIAPSQIVDKWVELEDTPKSKRKEPMWDAFGKKTITVMARGCRYLANIWDGAWQAGNGNKTIGSGDQLEADNLQKLYESPDFLESIALDKYKLKKDGKAVK